MTEEMTDCPNCGGPVRVVMAPGRTFVSKGRTHLIPEDLGIPTCSMCDARWVNETHLRAMASAVTPDEAS